MYLNEDFVKYFKRWILTNNHKFKYKMYMVRGIKNSNEFIAKFASIPNIEVFIDKNGKCDIWAKLKHNNKEYYDNLFDASINLKKDREGFYCGFCINRIYYKNRVNLWNEHLKILEKWILENINTNKKFELVFFGKTEDSSYEIRPI